jgi:DUF971 family protein
MFNVQPTNITADRQTRNLTITWDDGHTSVYPFSLVRYACPCVECRGGHEHMGEELDPGVFSMADEDSPATRIRKLEPVGTYALTIEWEDNHHFGIYNWRYLRSLCPCLTCRQGAVNE